MGGTFITLPFGARSFCRSFEGGLSSRTGALGEECGGGELFGGGGLFLRRGSGDGGESSSRLECGFGFLGHGGQSVTRGESGLTGRQKFIAVRCRDSQLGYKEVELSS